MTIAQGDHEIYYKKIKCEKSGAWSGGSEAGHGEAVKCGAVHDIKIDEVVLSPGILPAPLLSGLRRQSAATSHTVNVLENRVFLERAIPSTTEPVVPLNLINSLRG